LDGFPYFTIDQKSNKMTFCIISHVVHTEHNGLLYAYSPYVNEMNLWFKNVDNVIVVAPKENFSVNPILTNYNHSSILLFELKKIDFLNIKNSVVSLFSLPIIFWRIFMAMQQSDHIHLRCPGNIGLLGCCIQILFPNKPKTAKYAGNWDPNSKQPLSYRIQKWILNNTFLTRNMQVLVYGNWPNQSLNIKPFFTATYNEFEKNKIEPKKFSGKIEFVFVGTLSSGKQPMYAIQMVEEIKKRGFSIQLSLYGEGAERKGLTDYIAEKELSDFVFVKSNENKNTLKEIYQKSHFLILPSKSEGWPKVVAEAMFWGCLPIATSVSCVPDMLDFGERGILIKGSLIDDVDIIVSLLENQKECHNKINQAISWSRDYTIDKFENEIKSLLQT
jgi:glycosyltransferase involved in cell wall biosynthesis